MSVTVSPERRATIYAKVAEFIAYARDGKRSAHIVTEDFTAYMRRSIRCMGGGSYVALDIAGVDVFHPQQGVFKALLEACQDLCPWNAVCVECVNNEHLHAYLTRLKEADSRWMTDAASYHINFLWVKDPHTEHNYFNRVKSGPIHPDRRVSLS